MPGNRSVAPSSGGLHNVFFGLLPDEATRAAMRHAVERLRAAHPAQGRWPDAARYHLTLHFLGRYPGVPDGLIVAARAAAGQVRAPAFDLVLDRAGHFAHGVGWLGCAETATGLQRLWQVLGEALAQAGLAPKGHPGYKPHVTVLRDARSALPFQPIEPIRWPVRDFVLIDSEPGPRPVHEQRGCWRLAQPPVPPAAPR